MKIKTALIVPKSTLIGSGARELYHWEKYREYRSRMRLWSCPNLTLLTVAAMLPENYDVDYLDLNYCDMPEKDYDLALLSPSTSQAPGAYEIARGLRKRNTTVLMGGPHVSFCPEEALQYADSVFVGETEETFGRFLEDRKNNRVKRIYRCLRHPPLDMSPVPRYELARDYPYKSIPIQTSRGCPHQCAFCISSSLYGEKFRRKSMARIQHEIEVIRGIWNRPFLFFTDDNMFLESAAVLPLLKYLQACKLHWYCFSDVRVASKTQLLERIFLSGCTQLLIGFESLSAANLSQINRNQWKLSKRAGYEEAIGSIQEKGIGVVGSFVLGLENDEITVFDELYRFITDTNLYATNITILTPFPGTRLFSQYEHEDRLVTRDWTRYNGFELTYRPRKISVDEFEKGFVRLYEQLDSSERIDKLILYFKDIMKTTTKLKRGVIR